MFKKTLRKSTLSKETEALIEASRILRRAFRETIGEPNAICKFVYDAERYVDKLFEEHLFAETTKP